MPISATEAYRRWRQRNPEKAREKNRRGRKSAAAKASKKRNYERGARHRWNAHLWWKPEHDAMITAPDRPTDRESAKVIGRTVHAIQVRRSKLRKEAELGGAVAH